MSDSIRSLVRGAQAARRLSVLTLCALGCMALGMASADAQTSSAQKDSTQNKVVATIGTKTVTQGELDSFIAPQLMALRQQRQGLLEKGLDAYLSQEVLQREAAAQKLSVNELIAREVKAKVPATTDAEVDAFYKENQSRIQQPEDKIADQIKSYLNQKKEQKALAVYAAALKTKYRVTVLLEPLRIKVDAPNTPTRGAANAPVTIVEFGDFQCPFCGQLEPTLEKVEKNYRGKVRLAFRQYPLESIHPHAYKAAEASLCAREQGQFWALHDRMYAHQDELTVPDLKAAAKALGMNTTKFDQCLESGRYDKEISADLLAGTKAGVTGTPALFVNGRPVPGGAVSYDVLTKVIDDELARTGH